MATSNSWYLVKHVSNLFRDEPVNIGVVATVGPRWSSKFIGQDEEGKIDGRRLPGHVGSVDVYREWVEFINFEAGRGALDRRIQRLSGRLDSFRIERRGELLAMDMQQPIDAVVEMLFDSLVESSPNRAAAERTAPLAEAVDDVLRKLDFGGGSLRRRPKFEVEVAPGVPQQISFDYEYRNGHVTLMDKINLRQGTTALRQRVNDLLFRMEQVEQQRHVDNFLILHRGAKSGVSEKQLHILERVAHTVDVAEDRPELSVGAVLHVPVLPAAEQPQRLPDSSQKALAYPRAIGSTPYVEDSSSPDE